MTDLIAHTDLTPGMTVNVVRHENALGEPIRPIRRWDWRKVTLTAETLENYLSGVNGRYWFTLP